jgi:hypothetical protein
MVHVATEQLPGRRHSGNRADPPKGGWLTGDLLATSAQAQWPQADHQRRCTSATLTEMNFPVWSKAVFAQARSRLLAQ